MRLQGSRQFDCFKPVPGFSNYFKILFQFKTRTDAVPYQSMIIGDNNSSCFFHCSYAVERCCLFRGPKPNGHAIAGE